LATYLRVQSAGYINVTVPARSLLLTKPLPEAEGGVPHGGHAKFADQQDSAYQAFLYFIERYSACEADPP
jgi:hypothetical protein